MSEQTRVYVIDDDLAVLHSLQALLGLTDYSVRCFSSAQQFLECVPLDAAGCLITDMQMPEISGLDLLKTLSSANSPLSVIVVTGVADVPTAVAIMERGAVTLLEKPYDQSELLRAVERAVANSRERWIKQQDEKSIRERLATLSDEEQRVMKQMLSGAPNKAIACALNLSMRTVDRRRHSILEKMKVNSVPELAIFEVALF